MAKKTRDNVRTTAYWLRKAVSARANAGIYPEYKNALESLAELYEQLAERGLKAPTSRASGGAELR